MACTVCTLPHQKELSRLANRRRSAPARRLGWMNRDRIEDNWKQLAGNGWWWETMEAVPRPGDPDREAEHRWENEGGNPPMTEPPAG